MIKSRLMAGVALLVLAAGLKAQTPKNIILLIGDGMGLSQITAGMYAQNNHTALEKCTTSGLIKTHSSSNLITDSAAGATAFACGCKTYNGAIGVTRARQPCLTILEQAKAEGRAVGLVTSSSITHATPASFVAHVRSRADVEAIALFFLQTEIDFMVGGGLEYFNDRKKDTRNLYTELREKGHQLSTFQENPLPQTPPNPLHPFGWFSAKGEPDSVSGGRDYLPIAARLAPEFLQKRSEKGFFLMIEGAQIDWACHARQANRAVAEMIDFEAVIAEILRFAEADGETLVVVTADHETGGLALEQGAGLTVLEYDFTTGYHTATMVPVFAYGPGSKAFGGVLENTDIYAKMAQLWGYLPINAPSRKGD